MTFPWAAVTVVNRTTEFWWVATPNTTASKRSCTNSRIFERWTSQSIMNSSGITSSIAWHGRCWAASFKGIYDASFFLSDVTSLPRPDPRNPHAT
jgi:hypothetical protein